jgi:hypothetical protein
MARDPDATALLGRFLLGAVGLVVGGALLFALIGAVAGDDGDATAAPTTPVATDDEPDPTTTPTDAPTDAPTGPAETATDTPAPTETATDAGQAIDPDTVTVQVLDGTGGTGAASEVAGRLRDAGYRIIAENRAIRVYDATTVFYTEGNEDAARQIAAQFGFSVVEPKPANLSSSVRIHLVVGTDA